MSAGADTQRSQPSSGEQHIYSKTKQMTSYYHLHTSYHPSPLYDNYCYILKFSRFCYKEDSTSYIVILRQKVFEYVFSHYGLIFLTELMQSFMSVNLGQQKTQKKRDILVFTFPLFFNLVLKINYFTPFLCLIPLYVLKTFHMFVCP